MEYKAVIGLGFGDEGKGKTVSTLCQRSIDKGRTPIVVRYSGGQQAAHTVHLLNGARHVFSNFGSGTLQEVDTYWTKFCTMDPVGILNEYTVLKAHNVPLGRLFIHLDCPVTTPFDKEANRQWDKTMNHGSCGVGVGQTWQRHEDHFSITARDLWHPTALLLKLRNLVEHYYPTSCDTETTIAKFIEDCAKLVSIPEVLFCGPPPADEWIFEGTQGLLLDQDIGLFPHVTRSNVGVSAVRRLIGNAFLDVYLVTRSYQTRHGNGPMTYENQFTGYNPYESNSDYCFQGQFRTGLLDLDLLNYAIDSDKGIRTARHADLVINHMDIVCSDGLYRYVSNRKIYEKREKRDFVTDIACHLSPVFAHVSASESPKSDTFG